MADSAMSKSTSPAVKAGFRLVPALIGPADNAHTALIPCPTWCEIDHSTDRQVALEDVWHSGPFVDLEVPHRGGVELLAMFRLGLDPYSRDENKRRPFVFAEDAFTGVGHYMDPEHVEEFATKAIAALSRLREMARGCTGRAAAPESERSQADEALRRVTGGAA